MEPLLIIVLPGVLGGIVLAFVISRIGLRQWGPPNYEHLEPPSTNIINMARIRVSGIGGLGMVAMAIVVAAFVPSIRVSTAIAFGLGMALAIVLIAIRRRKGPLPSSQDPGGHLLLPIEQHQKNGSKRIRINPEI